MRTWEELLELFDARPERKAICTPLETQLLVTALARSIRAENVLELGSGEGDTAHMLSLVCQNVVTVDRDAKRARQVAERLRNRVRVVRAGAEAFLQECKAESYDMIYIDSSDIREGLLRRAREVVKKGGLIVVHDVRLLGKERLFDKVFRKDPRIVLPSYTEPNTDAGLGVVFVGDETS